MTESELIAIFHEYHVCSIWGFVAYDPKEVCNANEIREAMICEAAESGVEPIPEPGDDPSLTEGFDGPGFGI